MNAPNSAVDFDLTGDASKLLQQFQKIVVAQEKIAKGIIKATKTSKKGSKSVKDDIVGMVKGYVSVTAALTVVKQAMTAVIDENKRMETAIDQNTLNLDKNFRKTANQLGITSPDLLIETTAPIARRLAIDLAEASNAARELGSQGVSASEILHGGVLEETLKAAVATGQRENLGELAAAMTGFLREQGKEFNQENFGELGLNLFSLFKSNVLQASDLTQLAKLAPSAAGAGMDQQTMLAIFTLAKESAGNNAAQGETALRKLISSLQSAPSFEGKKARALKQAGISSDDIDLVGEKIGDVLDTLAVGLAGLPEKQRASFLKEIFGEEKMSSIRGIINKRGRLEGLIDSQTDAAGFNQALATSTTGRSAMQARATIDKILEESTGTEAFTVEAFRQALDTFAQQRGTSTGNRLLQNLRFSGLTGIGTNAEGAARYAADINPDFTFDELVEFMETQARSSQGQDNPAEMRRKQLEATDTTNGYLKTIAGLKEKEHKTEGVAPDSANIDR